MSFSTTGVPVIDPTVRYVRVSKLRELKAEKLRALGQTLVVQDDERPLAVVISFAQFLKMQQERERILEIVESFKRKEDQLRALNEEANAGKTSSLNHNGHRTAKERKAGERSPQRAAKRINGRQDKVD